MRTFLAVLAVVALAAVPAYAITFTGSISDWDPSLIRTNNIQTWQGGTNTLNILSYGAYLDHTGGVFYGFIQTATPIGTDADGWGGAGGYRGYPSAYIDIDNNSHTTIGNEYNSGNPLPAGVDVDIEYDMDDFTPGLNFWGPTNNDNQNSYIPVAGGVAVHSADGTMFEFSAPVSSIIASVASPYGDGADPILRLDCDYGRRSRAGLRSRTRWSVCDSRAGHDRHVDRRRFGGARLCPPTPEVRWPRAKKTFDNTTRDRFCGDLSFFRGKTFCRLANVEAKMTRRQSIRNVVQFLGSKDGLLLAALALMVVPGVSAGLARRVHLGR